MKNDFFLPFCQSFYSYRFRDEEESIQRRLQEIRKDSRCLIFDPDLRDYLGVGGGAKKDRFHGKSCK